MRDLFTRLLLHLIRPALDRYMFVIFPKNELPDGVQIVPLGKSVSQAVKREQG